MKSQTINSKFVMALATILASFGLSATPEEDLRDAARNNNLEQVISIVEQNPEININDQDPHNGQTALHCAVAMRASSEMVSYLLQHGADITLLDRFRDSVFNIAGSNELMNMLLDRLTFLTDEQQNSLLNRQSPFLSLRSPLSNAIARNLSLQTINRLIGAGANIHEIRPGFTGEYTLLDYALTYQNPAIILELLSYGALPLRELPLNITADLSIDTAFSHYTTLMIKALLYPRATQGYKAQENCMLLIKSGKIKSLNKEKWNSIGKQLLLFVDSIELDDQNVEYCKLVKAIRLIAQEIAAQTAQPPSLALLALRTLHNNPHVKKEWSGELPKLASEIQNFIPRIHPTTTTTTITTATHPTPTPSPSSEKRKRSDSDDESGEPEAKRVAQSSAVEEVD